jgi:hypothetical protein
MPAESNLLSQLLRDHPCLVPITEKDKQAALRFGQANLDALLKKGGVSHPSWIGLYYGPNLKTAQKHFDRLLKDLPEEAEKIRPGVEDFIRIATEAEKQRLQLKAEKEARKQAREEKKTQREALGVDLKSKGGEHATPETYNTLRELLHPVELSLRARLAEQLTKMEEQTSADLRAASWNAAKAYPYRAPNGKRYDTSIGTLPPFFYDFFRFDHDKGPHIVEPKRPEARQAFIERESTQQARDDVWCFAAKLAGKIDGELAELGGGTIRSITLHGDMWTGSTLTVDTTRGTQRWETQVIVNVSCLGKLFNQWPTRRVGLSLNNQQEQAAVTEAKGPGRKL